jgi:segregation and condensation protein B
VNAHQIVEAVLFASDAPLTADEIARADETLDEDLVEDALQFLRAEYDDAGRSFEILQVAEGYQILTRPEFAPYLERFDNVPRPSRLSGPALETLAIIAYRQPLGRVEIEYVRGVGASGVVRSLQDRRLIDVVGRGEGLGRPLLYGTTSFFLEHFGFKSLEDLPRPEELPVVLRERIPLGPETVEDEEEGAQGELLEPDVGAEEGATESAASAEGAEEASDEASDEDGGTPEDDDGMPDAGSDELGDVLEEGGADDASLGEGVDSDDDASDDDASDDDTSDDEARDDDAPDEDASEPAERKGTEPA